MMRMVGILGRLKRARSCRKRLTSELEKLGSKSADTLVLSSPLTRALETAVLVSQQLGVLTTDSNFQVR